MPQTRITTEQIETVDVTKLVGIVQVENGGTGQTTSQAALNALVGTQTANRVLRSDGTNTSLSLLNASTDVTGILAIANGGTGQSTAANAINALLPTQTSNSGKFLTTNGTSASWQSQVYDLGLTISGKPDASATVLSFVATRAFTLPSGYTSSRAAAGTPATSSAVFTINKNGSSIGTITFAGAASTGSFSGSGGSFAAGDLLTIIAPSQQDSTLANASIVLVATI